ncbi:ImmA/IrrE family metallo-endopeptidase [Pediococcus pentosaceus]|uniref:ImmA/IrrE family metallo-endopeptidase n=1 Tax=Pediococcus pentosaceus TaxID=1255 RepID=UPI0039EA204E
MTKRVSQLNRHNLKFARQLRGYSSNDLAQKMGIKYPATISNWETGKRSPDFLSINKLSEILRVPYNFLINTESYSDENSVTLFRGPANTTKKVKLSFERKIDLYGKFISNLSKIINLPPFEFTDLQCKNADFKMTNDDKISQIAYNVRKKFGLGNGPIRNVTAFLERNGIFVVFTNDDSGVNALTKKIDGRYIVLLNIANQSSARVRFSLAHELGHILLHINYKSNDLNDKNQFRRMETEAHYFASCLLMPEEGFLLDVMSPTLGGLVNIKPHWKSSVQSMAVRLNQLGIINEIQKVNIFRELSRKYSRKAEPFDFGENRIPYEYPSLVNAIYEHLDGAMDKSLEIKGFKNNFIQNEFLGLKLTNKQDSIDTKPNLYIV